jgi:putative glutamine amidotransferase
MRRKSIVTYFLSAFFAVNCGFGQISTMKIGISKASGNYINWLKRTDSTLVLINLYGLPLKQAVLELRTCDGLLLTGGEDIYPGRYGMEADTSRCTEMDLHRDTLEMALLSEALGLKIPVFGICRGNQVLNVFLGGTLIVDIPQDFGNHIRHQCVDYLHCTHMVYIDRNSMLSKICRCDSALVTTNHHQAAGRLANQLRTNARAADNLVEGTEWLSPVGKSFLMGVQWHPERMEKENPLSGKLAGVFIRQTEIYAKQKNIDRK